MPIPHVLTVTILYALTLINQHNKQGVSEASPPACIAYAN